MFGEYMNVLIITYLVEQSYSLVVLGDIPSKACLSTFISLLAERTVADSPYYMKI